MPTSRRKSSSKSRSRSKKSSSTKRHVAKTRGPLRYINNFMGDVKDLQPGIVSTGTGGFDIGLVPKGRKQTSLSDLIYGNAPSRKMTEVDRFRAATAAYGEGKELAPDDRIRCLQDEYRNLRGECTPKPASGMNMYNYSNPTDVYIPRPGIFGGSERIVRHTRPDGRQVSRVETMNSTNGLMSMFLNPGSEKSDGFYDVLGNKRKFMPLRYSTTWNDNGVPRDLPDGFIVGPNSTNENRGDDQYGKVYQQNDDMGMKADGLHYGTIIRDGKRVGVAAPINYLNGRSGPAGQRPISTSGLTLGSMFNLPEFPPKGPAAVGPLQALFNNRNGVRQAPPVWANQPMASSERFRSLGRYY